jgi:MFS family permease
MSLRTIIVVYFIFGFAYNIYATYFVAFMVEEVRLAQKTAGNIWAMFGWLSMVSGLLWGFLSDRLGRRRVLIWNNGLISLALLLPLFFHQLFFIITSTFLFGLTFIGTVTVIAASIGDQAGEKRASLYGLVTLIHGIGQLIGTTSGGFLKDLSQSFQLTLTASLAGFLLCFILIVLNKKTM